jgi:hypothetical protein
MKNATATKAAPGPAKAGTIYEFAMNQKVTLLSGERGHIIGRAEYQHSCPSFLVRYKAGDGRLVESWWVADAMKASK